MVRFKTLFSLCLIVLCVGCSGKAPIQPSEPVANGKRQPLKIWLIDAPELERELSVRWQVNSDQEIRIEKITNADVVTQSFSGIDVLIYPANLMGDLVQLGAIGKLPVQVLNSSPTQVDSIPSGSSTLRTSDASDDWPVRWKANATFAGQKYALPLGTSPLVAISNHMPPSISDLVEAFSTSTSGQPVSSLNAWQRFIKVTEESLQANRTERVEAFNQKIANLSVEAKEDLVDRFLWLFSSTLTRRLGLFDLDTMQSRLHEPEFVEVAGLLVQLAGLFPETMLGSPTETWESVVLSESNLPSFTIGAPKALSAATPIPSDSLVALPWTWNSSRGLMASVGKNTRQTSVSANFVKWLGEPDQRVALRSVCGLVELSPGQNDSSISRKDYREFQRIIKQDLPAEGTDLALRMANTNQYRTILGDRLAEILKSPEQSSTILTKTSQQWDELTKSLGLDRQRESLEKSLGYRK